MTITPFPHQHTGSDFLAERGFAFLWDEPGLGKTGTAVMAADKVGARKILVVCPAVVRNVWAETFVDWQAIDRPINVVEGFVSEKPVDGVTIVSHACLADVAPPPGGKKKPRETYSLAMLQQGGPYDLIVLDEGHEMREFDAARARNFYMPDGLWAYATRVWALTGTPIVNSAADLWLPAFGPLRMPVTWWDWGNRFAEMRPGAYGDVRPIGLKNERDLADILRPNALRRTLESVGIDLPPLEIARVDTDLPQEAIDAVMGELDGWTPMRVAAALDLGDEPRDAAMARVRQALGIAKVPFAVERTRAILDAGEGPVVVFFHHTEVRKRMFDALRADGRQVSWIDGKVTRPQLRAAKDWFQAGRLDVLLVQTQAGGTGLTLVRGSRVVVAELPWTAVALFQAIKRVHRITQTRACRAEILRGKGCWLEDVLATVVARKEVASAKLLDLLTTNQ